MLEQARSPSVGHAIALAALVLGAFSSALPGLAETPAERFRTTLGAATANDAPRAELARLGPPTRRLDALGSRRVAPPTLEWQSEGLGDGREPNAADSLRWQQELSWPGQRRALGAFAEVAGTAESLEIRAALAALRLEAGGVWLELAALADERAVLDRRVARLERAIALHEKRLELGEVAGAEVVQLELERARDEVERRRLDAGTARLEAELERLAPGAPSPEAGDLAGLLEGRHGFAPTRRPEDPFLDAVRAEARRGEQLARLDATLAMGRPAGELEVQRIPSTGVSESFESFSLQVSVPLALGRSVRERRAAAETRAELARADLAAEEQRSRTRIERAAAELHAAEASLDSLGVLLAELPRTEHSLAEQFRLGAVSYLVYLDGLGRLDQLRLDAARVRGEAARARFELAVLTSDDSIFPTGSTSAATAKSPPEPSNHVAPEASP